MRTTPGDGETPQTPNLPKPPARVFMVGVGGIGMSGLAQLLRWEGYAVAGSDRGLGEPGKAELYRALKRQGVFLYPQDGSGIRAIRPDVIIHSTAVEEGNPDFLAAEQLGVPRLHRARALSQALAEAGGELITVAGSCGKTSVTGWIASALRSLGEQVLVVNGGYEVDSVPGMPGNFRADQFPRWLVAEVDESDKSLDQFTPDYGLLLNVGNDHYDQTELRRVFAGYLSSCRKAVVTSAALHELASSLSAPVALFGETAEDTEAAVRPVNYQAEPEGIEFDATNVGHVRTSQYGHHSAANASAVLSLLRQLGLGKADDELCRALGAFQGIRQRFEVVGHLGNGTPLVN
ncbi:MAG: hypothetical protein IJJ33_01450, partial [Victivallales bacterium]|nr:hypothetical protein [Victivallales bacterium]